MIDQITELLGQICKGKDREYKMKFLESLGYTSWQQVVELDGRGKEWLIKKLQSMKGDEYITFDWQGYTITRPVKPKNVSQISFSINGHKLF